VFVNGTFARWLYGRVPTSRKWWIMPTLPSYSQALDSALSIVHQVSVLEKVPLDKGIRRCLGEPIIANRDLPPYNRSQMDGYAVVASEVQYGKAMKVLGEVLVGASYDATHQPNTCVAIATGASVPDCFDAVVQHEMTDAGEQVVTFHCDAIQDGNAIHPQGSDAKAGDILLEQYSVIAPQHTGITASVGCETLKVLSKPKVIVITSGDEVVAPNVQALPHQINNGNNPMVATAFASMGCEVVEAHHVQDDKDATNDALETSFDGRCDLVVTIGGISAGKRDFFPSAFEQAGVELVVKGANVQPGKPIIVGKRENTMLLGLPGNPVSALACCCIFGWPIVHGLLGCTTTLTWQFLPLDSLTKPNLRRTSFRPCIFKDGKISIPQWQGSGDLAHTANTTGLVQLFPSDDEFEAGSQVPYLPYPWC